MSYSTIRTLAALSLAVVATAAAVAQEKYPSRPIEMVIPTAAGGGTDISLRMLAELAEPALGQKIVIVNKTGGGGTVGMAGIVTAKPDGYTIGGLWNAPLTMTPHMLPAPYKPSDYAAVTLVTWAPTVLCVKAAFPANDGKAFIEELKKNPNKYTYGNDGLGGTLHLASERVFQKVGVKARPVPFAGAGETLKAFLGDHIDIYAGSIAPVMPYVKDKSAKCLMVTSPDRNPALPDAASLTDLGVPNESTVLWRGIIAPKTVPADRLAVLQKAFADAAQSAKFKDFMEKRGEETRGSSSAEFRKLIDSEYAAMGQVMESVGLAKK
ncbi:MAG TPA: tripartite tricarboxylate transporter substrate binding protein [Casimicrobiaceae bacterium]|nr:tripartite tricarboxylate transporter substrate binding protein [Casimicrobiaceae bacterium]